MSEKTPACSIIIPVFNKWNLTRDCLSSLRDTTQGHEYEVIVVDNGSGDETATDLKPFGQGLFGPRFRVIRFEENRNFGPACNAGARAAQASILFFLNNDTLLTPGWSEPLLTALREEPDLGAVGPLLLYQDDTVQHLGVAYAPEQAMHLYRGFPRRHAVTSQRRDLQCITGAALMVHAPLFHRCGGFFEDYRNGYEDQELCLRIRQAGKRLTCIPQSVVYHLESQTSGRYGDESHNTNLFIGRCGASILSDLHSHAERDGFSLFVDDFLHVGLKLAPEREQALTRQAEGQSWQTWKAMIAENPLWMGGYELCADSLARQGKHTQEMELRLHLARLAPTLRRYLDVLRLTKRLAGPPPWFPTFEKELLEIQRFRSDEALAVRKIRHLEKTFPARGTDVYARLWREKLAELFPPA